MYLKAILSKLPLFQNWYFPKISTSVLKDFQAPSFWFVNNQCSNLPLLIPTTSHSYLVENTLCKLLYLFFHTEVCFPFLFSKLSFLNSVIYLPIQTKFEACSNLYLIDVL